MVQTPNAPTGVTASDGTYSDRIHVSWNTVAGITGYDIYRNTADNSSTATKITSTSSSLLQIDDSDVSPAVTYYYWVRSKIVVGGNTTLSAFSTSDQGWLMVQTPNAPTGVTASDGTHSDGIYVSWNMVAGVTGYDVYRNTTDNTSTATKIASTASTLREIDDSDVSPAITYYYWVRSKIVVGGITTQSAFSASDQGTLGGGSIFDFDFIKDFKLYQNYPNPFASMTTIQFDIPEFSKVEIVIFDLTGNKIKTLFCENSMPGRYKIEWNGKDDKGRKIMKGIYVCKMNTSRIELYRKIIFND